MKKDQQKKHLIDMMKADEELGLYEETYTLSFRGLLSGTIKDDSILNATLDNIELYLRRHYSKNGHPAIVFDLDENEFSIVTLSKQ
jgi:hypothetical protein